MPTLAQSLELLKTSLAAAYPRRVVSRDLRDLDQQRKQDLAAGLYTIVSAGSDQYPNYRGREGNFARVQVVVIGQIELAEDAAPSAVEDAELAMLEELQAFTRQVLPQGIDALVLTAHQSSRQTEHPYGWIAVQMEFMGA
jgi:hypothetical protein